MSRKKQQKTLEELLEEALVPEEEQPYEVPENWVWVRLGSVAQVNMGQSPKGEFTTDNPVGTVPLVGGPADMGLDYPDTKRYTSQPTKISNENDLIVSVRATLGKTNFSDKKYCLGRGVAGISSPYLDLRLLRYYFKVVEDYLYEISSGTTFSQISRDDLTNLHFPLPPLPEQKRIVARVESLLGKINEAKELIEEAKETFETRRASILAKAFRGELTKKWREQHTHIEPADQLLERIKAEKEKVKGTKKSRKQKTDLPPIDPPYELPKGWKWVQIEQLFNVVGGGTPSKSNPRYWGGTIPWVSPKDMKSNFIRETIDTITEEGLESSSATLVNEGSVAIVVRSGILRHTLPVAVLEKNSTVNQDLKVFDSGLYDLNIYLFWYIKGHQKLLIDRYTKSGTTVQSFLTDKFLNHLIPLPPLLEIKEINATLNRIFAQEEHTEHFLLLEDNLNSLTRSILNKAFRGELGTNDPEEESALELLKEVLSEQTGEKTDDPKSKFSRQGTLLQV